MNDSPGAFQKFRATQADEFFKLIKTRGLLGNEETEAVVHALVDISESVEKIYGELIPRMLNSSDSTGDDLRDQLWDIREEFRHIEYHIGDGKLTDL